MDEIKSAIRDIPDFPKPGIIFKDITPLLKDARLFKKSVDLLAKQFEDKKIDKVASIESRGFIFGSAVAYKLGASFVPVRKKGKLPHLTYFSEYELEYGKDILEMHQDAISKGENVLIIDDLLATGGTL
ncbi:MAG: adenine phosphoribosyltransferase, partial [Candidatus Omnitrophota bacterium]|nr:adenine phosphoribosyltransferase [Candidatus Omnitrophota bacterium]